MGWLGRSIGQFGADAGTAAGIAQDRRLKEEEAKAARVREQLQMLMIPLQIQEIQQRIAQANRPSFVGTAGTRGGGTVGLTFDPTKGIIGRQPLEEGADPNDTITEMEGWLKNTPKEFQPAIQSSIDAIAHGADPDKEVAKAQKVLETAGIKATPTGTTLNRLEEQLNKQIASGDVQGAELTRKIITDINKTTAKPTAPTYWKLRTEALLPGPEGDAARAALAEDDKMQMARLKARGMSFGMGRLYQMRTYVNADGTQEDMTGFEYERRKAAGEVLQPTGRLAANTLVMYQRLKKETPPALAAVEKDLGAFDNPSDRAIFARVLSPGPAYGHESEWLSNIMNQVLSGGGLSVQGQDLAVNLGRMAETMGPVRAALGLPSTDAAMNLTLSLIPGPRTPNRRVAEEQVRNLRSIIDNSINLPMLTGTPGGTPAAPPGGGNAPPPGAKIIPLNEFIK